ncbi:hypothetical protein GCM10011571_10680 [Marinithermofilum abyssi]|uniref:DUF3189 family protein n=1 Tax=Marinithermofilum abyssi TaxID=1571185 RepID=A0A8J2VH15_9BACL|nr:DUF3189 family protein [Marinithermofilum abyssi]GGE11230.1 hypothetical protein GCM10011571_10680 [Marinithermofilum abyssi]
MNIIYQCYGSAHSSVIAAAIHLGKLPAHRIPSRQEILSLADFDQATNDTLGTLFYKGQDEFGNTVYTIGLGRDWKTGRRAIESIVYYLPISSGHVRLVHALNCITLLTKVGGALSRRYGWTAVGRPLAAWGIQQSYPRLLALVEGVKRELS